MEARSVESAVGLWGGPATGRGERCKLPSGSPQPPRVLLLSVFSGDLPCY